jgi:hypothetical protein
MNKTTGERMIGDENSRAALWPVLTKIDGDLAEQAWIEGCVHCGGALHRADYPRKSARLHPSLDRATPRRAQNHRAQPTHPVLILPAVSSITPIVATPSITSKMVPSITEVMLTLIFSK